MKAWLTEALGVKSVVLAETRSQARAVTVRAAKDAGFRVGFLEPCSVRRAPRFDALSTVQMRGRAWTLEFASLAICARDAADIVRPPGHPLGQGGR